MSLENMTVYGWVSMSGGGQLRCIVRAKSFAAAARAVEAAGLGRLSKDYSSETFNDQELLAAVEPGVVLGRSLDDRRPTAADYRPIRRGRLVDVQ